MTILETRQSSQPIDPLRIGDPVFEAKVLTLLKRPSPLIEGSAPAKMFEAACCFSPRTEIASRFDLRIIFKVADELFRQTITVGGSIVPETKALTVIPDRIVPYFVVTTVTPLAH